MLVDQLAAPVPTGELASCISPGRVAASETGCGNMASGSFRLCELLAHRRQRTQVLLECGRVYRHRRLLGWSRRQCGRDPACRDR